MKKNIKLTTLIAAFAVGLSLTTAVSAKERGNRGHNNGGAQVIVNGPDYVYYEPGHRNNRAQAYQPRGNRHAYGRPYYSRADYKRMKKRQKKQRMRRMRRAYQDHYYDRPVIVIPFPHFIR